MQFTYSNPTRIHFGQNQIKAITDEIPSHTKVLVAYGGGSIKKNGIYDQVEAALSDHEWIEFPGIEANPKVETLDKAVEICRKEKVDFLLAVGGGSVIDGVKYIAAATLYEGVGWDILEQKHTFSEALPLGVVLTLPATGSESNPASVVSNGATGDKLSFYNPAVYPKFAILDPDVMKSLPERQIINGLVDAWVHICEQYLTRSTGAMVQDGYAEALLRNLTVLAHQYDKRDTDDWRANLMWVANQALNGLIGLGVPHDWSTHMIGHELTARYGVDHARSLSIIQPSLLRNQLSYKREKLEQMGKAVFNLKDGDDLAERTIKAIETFYQDLGMPIQLSDYNEDKARAITAVVSQLKKHGFVQLSENQSITLEKTREILEEAFV